MLAIVVLLGLTVTAMSLGFSQTLSDAESVDVFLEDRCADDRTLEFRGDFGEFHDVLQDNPCALWLDGTDVATDDAGRVATWTDRGPNEYDAMQSDPSQRPTLLPAGSGPGGIDAPVVEFENNATLRPGCDLGDHGNDGGCASDGNRGIRYYDEGDYLRIDRSARDLGVDEDTGMAIASVVYVEAFDRGGTWTIGEAGADGREFSMRTCGADATWGGCGHSSDGPEDHWRAQHWGSQDVDFEANSSGEWIVLVHAYDGEETTIRVDGREVGSESTALDLSQNRDVQLGRWERTSGDPSFYLEGAVAEVLVFDRAMEDSELTAIEEYFAQRYDPVDT